jgi:3-dehydroquinate synthase
MQHPVSVQLNKVTDRSYRIFFQGLSTLPALMQAHGLTGKRCFVVSDENVAALYRSTIHEALTQSGYEALWIVLPAGEPTKSLAHLGTIYDVALEAKVDRKTPIIALGGGVMGDLAGFAAASLLRGLPFIQIPTTLMSQVDSSVGGKTGINHPAGKNLIGAFHQPKFVLCDFDSLRSLPEREWHSGLAEVVKHALIEDAALFEELSANWDAILQRDFSVIAPIIRRSVEIKADVVSEDETEQGKRAHLNFGHTFAHAIEQVTGYKRFLHGEAVSLGMIAALHLSAAHTPNFPLEKALSLVNRLPVAASATDLSLSELMDAMKGDKKASGGNLRFVLLDKIGSAFVSSEPSESQIEAAWHFILHQA